MDCWRTQTTVIIGSIVTSSLAFGLLLGLLLLLLHQAKVEAIVGSLGRRGLGIGSGG